MGILYDKTMEYKKQFVIDELNELNVTISRDGISLEDLNYNELKQELSIARSARG